MEVIFFFVCQSCRIYQFKGKDSETKPYSLCLSNISKDFTINNIKNGLNGYVHDFSVGYNTIDVSDILDIHKYLTKTMVGNNLQIY